MDLPKDLSEETKKICMAKTKTGTVILSLQKLIQSKKIERRILPYAFTEHGAIMLANVLLILHTVDAVCRPAP
jgi:hypothetical protein